MIPGDFNTRIGNLSAAEACLFGITLCPPGLQTIWIGFSSFVRAIDYSYLVRLSETIRVTQ